ncbi:hypothetical protein G9C98_001911 [Cotesia typhae]|uniref:Protein halfway n=1 Tax=Cotesia typhae TaxID=2053667 RepID=A0A8J5VBN9_9HYME|nr:hypothetical protein G9C98_001911 [Cotesia typhae]
MHILSLSICIYGYVAFTSARTEEDQASSPAANTEMRLGIPPPERCFYQDASECPEIENSDDCPCKRIPILSSSNNEEYAVFCCDLNIKTFETGLACSNFPVNVSYIHIRNATLEALNVSEVKWRRLKSLAITDGKINRIKGQFLMMTPTHCLNLSNNALTEIENNSFTRLSQLTSLDLSYNNMTHLPALNIMNGREFWLDISGTNTLWCHDVSQYINKTGDKQIIFNRENETVCSASKTWRWFNTTEQVPLEQVRLLSLVPTYILVPNVHNKNHLSHRYVKLGGNKLLCNCNTAKYLKPWLQTNILDPDEVLCENVKEKVVDLEPSKMCVHPGDWTDYIYYLIAFETLMLISLIAKVSYDYWIFKTAGYLPWPANKMPKLPCDWLCEA